MVTLPNGLRVIIADIGSVLFTFDPEHRFKRLSERTGLGRDELNRLLFAPPTATEEAFETRCEAGEFTPIKSATASPTSPASTATPKSSAACGPRPSPSTGRCSTP
ncbi:hypothetical protein GCM10029992_38380 [Glycomyces albus]